MVARLARRRERRRAYSHQADDADTTSEDGSVRREPPSLIFEPSPPASEVEVQASSPVKVDRLPTGPRGNTPSGSERRTLIARRPLSSSKRVKEKGGRGGKGGGSSKHSSSKSPGSRKGGDQRSSSHSYPIDPPSDSHGRGRKSTKGQDRDDHTSKERGSSPLHSKSRSRSETGTTAVFRSPRPVDRTRSAPAGSPSPGSPVRWVFCPGTGPSSRPGSGTNAFPSVLAAVLHAVPGNAGGHAECSLHIPRSTPAA